LLDCDNGALSILDVPEELSFRGGVSGLAVTDRYVFAVTTRSHPGDPASGEPRGPSTLTVFDRRNLTPLSRHVFTRIFDAHAICAGQDRLDIVSTGTDEVDGSRSMDPPCCRKTYCGGRMRRVRAPMCIT